MWVLSLNVYFYIPYPFNQPLLSGEQIWCRISHNEELRLMLRKIINRGGWGGRGTRHVWWIWHCVHNLVLKSREGTICKLGIDGNILKWILQEDGRRWDSVVVVVIRLRAERSGVRIPEAERDFFKWNTNLMQHCAGFISAESLYMFRAQAPIIRSI